MTTLILIEILHTSKDIFYGEGTSVMGHECNQFSARDSVEVYLLLFSKLLI